MKDAMHISEARRRLDSGARVTLRVVKKKDGSIMEAEDCVSLSADRYKGTRTIKLLRSGQKRMIHDCCIIGIDGYEVFL